MQVCSSMNMQKPGVPSLHLWLAAQQDIHTLLTDSLYRTGSPQTEPASPRQAHRSEDYEIQDERSETRLDAVPWSQSVCAVGCPSSPRPLRDLTPSLLNSSNLTICTLHVPLKQGQQPVHVMWAPALLSPINAHPQRSGTSPSSGTAPSVCPVLSRVAGCLFRRTCTPSRTLLADPDRQKRSHERGRHAGTRHTRATIRGTAVMGL
ncbi:hypothetical protein K456DRAFT_1929005 [Colletotrichum gloeosporioides 23]|nr:hypothetical protein K456DRAFT_1929005 [Colletotrichum gloeosporioides 23]